MRPLEDYQSLRTGLKMRKLRVPDGEMPTQAAVPPGVAIEQEGKVGGNQPA